MMARKGKGRFYAEERPYLYFAYGSNLNRYQIKMRCPLITPVKKVVLEDHRLVFKGVADVEPCKGEKVYGALYKITRLCEKALDIYEGYREGGRGLYDKAFLDLEGGGTMMLYFMTRGRYAPPSDYYLNVIREGYKHWDLPVDHLDKVVEKADMADDDLAVA